MISDSNTNKYIKKVKYFDDLKITAAFHRRFPCGITHRKTACRKGAYSLELILNGDVLLNLDNKKFRLAAPCVFWIGDHHNTFQFELIPGEIYDHYWIDFTGERGRRIYEALSDAFPESFLKLESVKNIRQIFERFSREFKIARTPVSQEEEILLIEQLMLEIIKQSKATEQSENDPYGLEELTEQIKKFPFKHYDLKALAYKCNVSYIHFRMLFKKKTGKPIRQFILEQQMLAAGELLKSHEFRIGELADYCGFQDIASFSRAFKRYHQVSPKQWRKDFEQ